MKYYIILLLVLFESNVTLAQCDWGTSINGNGGWIINNGDNVFSDTISICSGESISLDIVPQSGASISDWKINGIAQGINTQISKTYINETNTASNYEFIMLSYFNGDCWTDTLVVAVYPRPSISITHKDLDCPSISQSTGDGAIFIESNHPIDSSSYMGGWNTTYINIANDSTYYDTIPYLTASNDYNVFISDTNNCYSDTVYNIEIINPDQFLIETETIDDNCGQKTGSVTFHASGGTMPYTYTLSNSFLGVSITTQDSIIHGLEGSSNGVTYDYYLTDANNCNFTPSNNIFSISIDDETPPDSPDFQGTINYCPNDAVVLHEDEDDYTYFYYFNDFSDSTYTTGNSINLTSSLLDNYDSIYAFRIGDLGQDNEGCRSDSVVILIKEKDCDTIDNTPNITTNSFSPNDPLHPENNTFIIDLSHIDDPTINDVKVTIMNRWGDVIYQTENYDNEKNVWNGDNQKGGSVPEGTYFYTIEIPSIGYNESNWVYLDLK